MIFTYFIFIFLLITGIKTVTFKFRDQGICAKQCQQVYISLRTIAYWNIQIIKNIQYLRNTHRNFFFFLEKFKYYLYLILMHYLHFFKETAFITDNWFFEGSFVITILSGIEHPSVILYFLRFKWKCHEGWGVRLEEVWLMFDAGRKCWKLNTRRSKINKPVQSITIQFWE